jgi:hypothetical protein
MMMVRKTYCTFSAAQKMANNVLSMQKNGKKVKIHIVMVKNLILVRHLVSCIYFVHVHLVFALIFYPFTHRKGWEKTTFFILS